MLNDPVKVTVMWQATCDSCGWHTQPAEPESAVREWARLHRVTCPLKPAPLPEPTPCRVPGAAEKGVCAYAGSDGKDACVAECIWQGGDQGVNKEGE